MTVDHKAIREAVEKNMYSISFYNRFANEQQIFSTYAKDEEEALNHFWESHPKTRYFLTDDDFSVYEVNKQEREWLLQLLDENQALKDQLETAKGFNEVYEQAHKEMKEQRQAQAKEIERYREVMEYYEKSYGLEFDKRRVLEKQIAQLQADKAAAVEALREYANGLLDRKLARTTLQRIESGDKE